MLEGDIMKVSVLTLFFTLFILVTPISALDISTCGGKNNANTILYLTADLGVGDVLSGGNCIVFQADNMTLDCQGYSLTGNVSKGGFGISGDGEYNITVIDCIIQNFSQGLRFDNTDLMNISNNTITANTARGIRLRYTTNALIEDNVIYNNTCTSEECGILVELDSDHVIIKNNNISGRDVSTDRNGIRVYDLVNATIESNIVHTTYHIGIRLMNINDSTIKYNTVYDIANGHGINLNVYGGTDNPEKCSNNKIYGNTIYDIHAWDGIGMSGIYGQVYDNIIYDINDDCIRTSYRESELGLVVGHSNRFWNNSCDTAGVLGIKFMDWNLTSENSTYINVGPSWNISRGHGAVAFGSRSYGPIAAYDNNITNATIAHNEVGVHSIAGSYDNIVKDCSFSNNTWDYYVWDNSSLQGIDNNHDINSQIYIADSSNLTLNYSDGFSLWSEDGNTMDDNYLNKLIETGNYTLRSSTNPPSSGNYALNLSWNTNPVTGVHDIGSNIFAPIDSGAVTFTDFTLTTSKILFDNTESQKVVFTGNTKIVVD